MLYIENTYPFRSFVRESVPRKATVNKNKQPPLYWKLDFVTMPVTAQWNHTCDGTSSRCQYSMNQCDYKVINGNDIEVQHQRKSFELNSSSQLTAYGALKQWYQYFKLSAISNLFLFDGVHFWGLLCDPKCAFIMCFVHWIPALSIFTFHCILSFPLINHFESKHW